MELPPSSRRTVKIAKPPFAPTTRTWLARDRCWIVPPMACGPDACVAASGEPDHVLGRSCMRVRAHLRGRSAQHCHVRTRQRGAVAVAFAHGCGMGALHRIQRGRTGGQAQRVGQPACGKHATPDQALCARPRPVALPGGSGIGGAWFLHRPGHHSGAGGGHNGFRPAREGCIATPTGRFRAREAVRCWSRKHDSRTAALVRSSRTGSHGIATDVTCGGRTARRFGALWANLWRICEKRVRFIF